MPKAAAIYARVSSEQQAIAGTIQSQVSALLERAKADEKKVPKSLQFIDEGFSGATLARPALERLRDTAYSGALDCIYIHSPDRLSRKYAYQILLVDEFRKAGVEVIFLNRHTRETPEDELLLQIQGILSEYERAKILERSRRGRLHAARKGAVSVLGAAPYGYRYLPKKFSIEREARYEVIPEEAEVVKKIYQWYCNDRITLSAIGRRLAAEGISTKTGKKWWDSKTVLGILKNPAYTGRAAFGKTRTGPRRPPSKRPTRRNNEFSRHEFSIYNRPRSEWIEIEVPGLVAPDLFEIAQEQLAINRVRARERKEGARYLLQGQIACGLCDRAFYARPVWYRDAEVSYVYYRCPGNDAYRSGGVRTCENGQVRGDLIERLVWDTVISALESPRDLEEEFLALEQDHSPTEGCEHPHLQATFRLLFFQLEDLASRQENLETLDWQSKRSLIRTVIKEVTIGLSQIYVSFRLGELAMPQSFSQSRAELPLERLTISLPRPKFRAPRLPSL